MLGKVVVVAVRADGEGDPGDGVGRDQRAAQVPHAVLPVGVAGRLEFGHGVDARAQIAKRIQPGVVADRRALHRPAQIVGPIQAQIDALYRRLVGLVGAVGVDVDEDQAADGGRRQLAKVVLAAILAGAQRDREDVRAAQPADRPDLLLPVQVVTRLVLGHGVVPGRQVAKRIKATQVAHRDAVDRGAKGRRPIQGDQDVGDPGLGRLALAVVVDVLEDEAGQPDLALAEAIAAGVLAGLQRNPPDHVEAVRRATGGPGRVEPVGVAGRLDLDQGVSARAERAETEGPAAVRGEGDPDALAQIIGPAQDNGRSADAGLAARRLAVVVDVPVDAPDEKRRRHFAEVVARAILPELQDDPGNFVRAARGSAQGARRVQPVQIVRDLRLGEPVRSSDQVVEEIEPVAVGARGAGDELAQGRLAVQPDRRDDASARVVA